MRSFISVPLALALVGSLSLQGCGGAPSNEAPRGNEWSELRTLAFPENYPTQAVTERL